MLVYDQNTYDLFANEIEEKLKEINFTRVVFPAGENTKNQCNYFKLLSLLAQNKFTRNDCIVAIGGGVIGDLCGFVASTYMRGISFVLCATTLLACVDSSVGGKTAINLPEGKNLVGAFYQPCEVLVAPSFLQTLPMREVKCGIGEIVKYAALDKEIFDMLTKQNDYTETSFLQGLIEKCIRYKVKVVEMDEKESGERRSLNVGHTTGHAIELSTGLSHGESVLYGMFFETQAAITYGVCDKEYGESLLAIVKKALAILPTSTPDFSNVKQYAEKAKTDKKNDSNDKVNMSVAKSKGVWTTFTLPFDSYVTALEKAVKSL
jgi:3-dehydroquinate synthase